MISFSALPIVTVLEKLFFFTAYIALHGNNTVHEFAVAMFDFT